MRDTVVIGDIHGCGEELQAMFDRLRTWARKSRIILIGDLLTKGPRPDGRTSELPPRLAEMVDILADADLLEDAQELLRRAMRTPFLRGRNPIWTAVHAGVDPALGFKRTTQRMRMTIKSAQGEDDWWWKYDGKDGLLIVGHKPLSRPLILRRPDGRAVVAAIDTGCVYGGFLTAYRIGADRLLMIPSKQRRQFNFKRRTSRRPTDSAWRAASVAPARKLLR